MPRRRTPAGALALALWLAGTAGAAASDIAATSMPQGALAALLAKVVPSVVAIHTWRVLDPAAGSPAKADGAARIGRAEGSGFIVSADGFVATNKHVVDGAYDVTVVLHEGGTMRARIVWESPVVDVAFLRVEADRPLAAATLAREGPEIGDRVVAVGNPLGLGISASAGIVSALDRNLKQSPYDRYIQTDAAINQGNSGGPLFNLAGEVVGMNSLSWTTVKNGGSDGLGFAIPGSQLGFLIDQLKRNGRIECGTIGLRAQKLSATMGEALGYPGHSGVIVAAVDRGSLAAEAGLLPGDVIRSFDGKALYDGTMLNVAVCEALGRTVTMDVWRGGRSLSVNAVLAKAAVEANGLDRRGMAVEPRFASAADLGMTLAPVDDETRQRYRLGADARGLVVVAVGDSSEAETRGLSAGDVIASLQMMPLPTSGSFDEVFARSGKAGRRNVIALVMTGGGDRWVTLPVNLGEGR